MKLPQVSGKDLLRVLCNDFGYQVRDQRGSHVHLRHATRAPLTVPLHSTIAKGTLLAILREAGISRDAFLRQLR